MVVEFRRVVGGTGVEQIFVFRRAILFGLLLEVCGMIIGIFRLELFLGMDFFEELFKRTIHVIFYSSPYKIILPILLIVQLLTFKPFIISLATCQTHICQCIINFIISLPKILLTHPIMILSQDSKVDLIREQKQLFAQIFSKTDNIWKIIIFDQANHDIISSLFKIKDFRQNNITLYFNIKQAREQLHGVTALYLVKPNFENTEEIIKDF